MCRSVPQIAVFSTLISTSLAPGAGTGTSSIQMPLPGSRLTSAFIVWAIAGPPWGKVRNYKPGPGSSPGATAILDGILNRLENSMRHSVKVLALALAACMGTAAAGEGMWVPQQLPQVADQLQKAGLELPPAQLADLTGQPMGAVVSLGGCTASFVSPQGLVVTNHHCAYGGLQLNSTPEKNLIEAGFNAATMGDEISSGPNARIYVLDSIEDVTAQAKAAIAAAPDAADRTAALEALEKKLVSECEAGDGFRCRFYSFAGGNTYRLFRNLEIRDVRVVYAPPQSIGAYGGDIDNWMWPRHTGDFTFIRAYVGPDGKPAAYSEENVPYQPKHWLRLASQPL